MVALPLAFQQDSDQLGRRYRFDQAESREFLIGCVDELVCLEVPKPFYAVHACYEEFPNVSDLDVRRLYAEASLRAKHWSFPH